MYHQSVRTRLAHVDSRMAELVLLVSSQRNRNSSCTLAARELYVSECHWYHTHRDLDCLVVAVRFDIEQPT